MFRSYNALRARTAGFRNHHPAEHPRHLSGRSRRPGVWLPWKGNSANTPRKVHGMLDLAAIGTQAPSDGTAPDGTIVPTPALSPAPGISARHVPRDGRTHELPSATKSAEGITMRVGQLADNQVWTVSTPLWPDKHSPAAHSGPQETAKWMGNRKEIGPRSCRQHNA